MKPIKITVQATNEIQIALRAVNGTATAHTLHDAVDIIDLAKQAEKTVVCLVAAKARAQGAVLVHTSGDSVARAYQNSRKATTVRLERRSSDWYLVDISEAKINTEAGKQKLWLSEAQDAFAITELRAQYSIIKPAV
ncbi:MAG TPA: hypothetical protein DCP03_13700 [Polaromonas sp.]|uniref:hypothetical protein n=1 Tax=Polaromonas sp. UBA4122 TaxID=1947074 RepID=UPI000EE2F291|nr:hypothetical protein [Polaromonas sp. UBA4122]HAL39094.1 hypothetical protein [Polaromonas sp.]